MEKQKLISASELENKSLTPVNWAIEGILPEGLTILDGAPKSGKSIFALNLALALSSDKEMLGKKNQSIKNVLYLPYEDSERRLQDRIIKNKNGMSITIDPKTFFFDGCNPPKIDARSLENMGYIIKENKIEVLIIDTLGSALKNNKRKSHSAYMDDYEVLNGFQRFAIGNKISLLLLHHTRKMKAENVFDEISGTRGITGAADANFVLQKNKLGGMLSIQGRDIEDQILDLELDTNTLVWKFKGLNNEMKLTPEQIQILNSFEKDNSIILSPIEIANRIEKADVNIRPNLGKLVNLGILIQPAYGKYKLASIN